MLQLFYQDTMITPINFLNINKISFKGNVTNETKLTPMPCDSFEKSSNAKYQETLKKAKEEIIETLHKKGIEEAIIISPEGKVLDRVFGNEHKAEIDTKKCGDCATLIHGHPEELALSQSDVELLFNAKMSTMIAVTPSGKISILKNSNPQRSVKSVIFEEDKCNYAGKIMHDLNISYDNEAHQLAFLYSDFAHNLNTTKRSAKLNNENLKDFAQKMGLEYSCDIFDEELAPKEDFFKWAQETEFTRTLLKESLSDFSKLGELDGKKYFGIIGNKNFILRTDSNKDFAQDFEGYEIVPAFGDPERVAIIKKPNSSEPKIEVVNSNNYKENFDTHFWQVRNFASPKNLYEAKIMADYYFNYD